MKKPLVTTTVRTLFHVDLLTDTTGNTILVAVTDPDLDRPPKELAVAIVEHIKAQLKRRPSGERYLPAKAKKAR
jgi:hypothetical protein